MAELMRKGETVRAGLTRPVHFTSKFGVRDIVVIDNSDLKAVVIGVLFNESDTPRYECNWIHNGAQQSAWIEQFRLELAD